MSKQPKRTDGIGDLPLYVVAVGTARPMTYRRLQVGRAVLATTARLQFLV